MAEYIHTQSGARVSVADGKVLGVDFAPVDGPEGAERPATPDKSWKVPELKAYADEQGIDLGAATKKDDILAALADGPGDSEDDESNADSDENESGNE